MKVTTTDTHEYDGLGQKIKECRKNSDKSITSLAADAGISVAYWNKIESENIVALPIETLRGIEKALGVSLIS